MCMSVEDAANRIGHEYPGGAIALAARLGMSGNVLNAKLNPNRDTHKLSLTEALRMQQLAGRYDILFAMADALGHVAVPMPDATDGDVSHALMRCCSGFGEYLRTVDASRADGKITTNERRDLERELTSLIAASSHLLSVLSGDGFSSGGA